jgi:hypothetical protein
MEDEHAAGAAFSFIFISGIKNTGVSRCDHVGVFAILPYLHLHRSLSAISRKAYISALMPMSRRIPLYISWYFLASMEFMIKYPSPDVEAKSSVIMSRATEVPREDFRAVRIPGVMPGRIR